MTSGNPKTTIGILSIGDMGGGIARLLVAEGFRVVTDVTGRRYTPVLISTHTHRA